MGKFSKPRKNFQDAEETAVLPKVPAEPEAPPAAPVNMSQTQDDFDSFDTEPAPKSRKSGRIILISLLCVFAALLIVVGSAFFYLMNLDPNKNLILNNVYVAGVNLGGMTQEEAIERLHSVTDETYTKMEMVVELPDAILSLTPADTGVSLNVEAAVEAAFNYGRNGTKEENASIQQALLSTDHHVAMLPYLNLDLEFIRGKLDSYGAEFNTDFLQSSAVVLGTQPILDAADEAFDPEAECQTLVLTLGEPGRYVDLDDVYNQILDAYSFNRFLVQIQLEEQDVFPDPLDLDALYTQYYQEPVNAVIDPETFEVTPEIYGYGFDLEAAQAAVAGASYGDEPIEIPMTMLAPEFTGEALSGVLFRDVLCEYKTEHTKETNRNTNLKLASEAINGTILYPGDIFDYNTVVGKRTEEKGYKPAGSYSGGKTVNTIGGGICQVSSTIYYCCLIADLEIINRLPHSFVSSYMPMGMDATVSWGGPEFTFRNNTNYPIRIETWVEGGYVHAKLIGTDEKDYYIKMEYEVVRNESYQTIYEEYPENNREGYRDGEVIQTPYRGYTVNTYKCKYDKETDELISRDFDRTSVYKARDRIIAKVVKETEPPTEPQPTEPPATNPPPTDPPATNPPPTDPPATNPPPTDPPATNPPPAAESSDET